MRWWSAVDRRGQVRAGGAVSVLALLLAGAGAWAGPAIRLGAAEPALASVAALHARAQATEQVDERRLRVTRLSSAASALLLRPGLALTTLASVSLPDGESGLVLVEEIELTLPDGARVAARVASAHPALGLALLAYDAGSGADAPSALAASPAATPPAPGAPLLLVANLDGSPAVVAATRRPPPATADPALRELIWLSAPADVRFAGAAVLDEGGRWAGVVVPAHADGAVAVPVGRVLPLLR